MIESNPAWLQMPKPINYSSIVYCSIVYIKSCALGTVGASRITNNYGPIFLTQRVEVIFKDPGPKSHTFNGNWDQGS